MKKDDMQEPKNGSMVTDEEELQEHSETMENMPTNEEVKEQGRQPDPKQH